MSTGRKCVTLQYSSGSHSRKNARKKISNALAGNWTRASRVAGENSTTEPPMPSWYHWLLFCFFCFSFFILFYFLAKKQTETLCCNVPGSCGTYMYTKKDAVWNNECLMTSQTWYLFIQREVNVIHHLVNCGLPSNISQTSNAFLCKFQYHSTIYLVTLNVYYNSLESTLLCPMGPTILTRYKHLCQLPLPKLKVFFHS